MILYVRSALFLIWFAAVSVALNVAGLPLLIFPWRATVWAANKWARLILFGLDHIAGLRMELRGSVPKGAALIAAKHFSTWETIALLAILDAPAIVIKRELLWVPLYGWYSIKQRMIPIDRSSGARAIRRMHAAAKRAIDERQPIVIFPEGTRKRPGAPPDYKPGVAALYAMLGLPCVPMAHNSGLFWRGWFLRKPGTVVVEFLEPIAPGLKRQEFMSQLEARLEGATNALLKKTT
jgi:1-acyl-sn-glycerol-3-phosphate acyltransferase